MKITKLFCFVLFLCMTTEAFPTGGNEPNLYEKKRFLSEDQKSNFTTTDSTESQNDNSSSLATTSSLLFKDTKPILTYLLGQPKNQGSLSSPAQLLSPDRYEFFTFDDDGQIVKKLMSVKEIQKIIANNEKGYTIEHETPLEYYQILTVTPDVESIPSLSRINPNEPLFSIHDVIASVQNVLKSEIKTKQSQSTLNGNNFPSTASSEHYEIMSKKPEIPDVVEAQKVTMTASSQASTTNKQLSNSPELSTESLLSTKGFTTSQVYDSVKEEFEVSTQKTLKPKEPVAQEFLKAEEAIPKESLRLKEEVLQETLKPKEPVQETQKLGEPILQETQKSKETVSQETLAPEELIPQETLKPEEQIPQETPKPEKPIPQDAMKPKEPASQETLKPEELVLQETAKPLLLTASIAPHDSVTFTEDSTPTATPSPSTSSSTFLSTQQKQTSSTSSASTTISTTVTAPALSNTRPGTTSNEFSDMEPFTLGQNWRIEEPDSEMTNTTKKPAENFFKVETLPGSSESEEDTKYGNLSEDLKNSSETQPISFTPDLANSVSNVLWQIASENAMLDNASKSKGSTLVGINQVTEKLETAESKNYEIKSTSSFSPTTYIPVEGLVKTEEMTENPIKVFEAILKPQNLLRPFQSASLIEKTTPQEAEEIAESVFSTTTTRFFPTFEEKLHSISVTGATATEVKETPSFETPSKSYESTLTSTSVEPTSTSNSEEATLASKLEEYNSRPPNKANQSGDQESFSTSSAAPPTFVVEVSPDAVIQSPEQLKPELKPATDKVILLVNETNPSNQTHQIIEGVTVIQEANIGQIPRTTEYPGQFVKEIQRVETPEPVSVDYENLTDSETNLFLKLLPSTETESATSIQDNSEEKAETRTESVGDEDGLLLTTERPQTEEKKVTPFEKLNVTFVPMIIKSPSDFKQEEILLGKEPGETFTEKEEEIPVEEKEEETVQASSNFPIPEDDDLESKILPDSDLKSILPSIDDDDHKLVAGHDSESQTGEEEIGSFKQNNPFQTIFGKPQRPIFGKPVKAKPQELSKSPKPVAKEPVRGASESKKPYESQYQSSPSLLELEAAPDENLGLEVTVASLEEDVKRFSDLCNELAFSLWSSVTHNGLSFVRSIVISPFAMTSLLAMVFLGARGPTSGQMNEILKLDDTVSFNPHLVFRNVTESLVISRNPGIATAAFVRELYSDKSKGKLLDFYKERAQQFYDGHVEEINFKSVGEILRRQTNHLVKRQTWGKITDFLRGSTLLPRPPLAAFSANIFQTDCTKASIKDRDGEMYFVILPASRLRRLVPIPAVVWRSDFLAGYEPQLDATVASISLAHSAVSTVFVLPGHQGLIAPGDTLARLEHQLLGYPYKKGHWSRLMRSLLPRPGLELQIPRLSHKSVINVTSSLQRMGLKDLFSAEKADLTGLNGLANDLHLSDMLQVNLFSTCGEESNGYRHHSEIYPATPILRREKSVDAILTESADNLFGISDFEDPSISALPLELRPRQARVPLSRPGAKIPEPPRLRFDRPFLFFVRHNPTGLILHMGRFNPRLSP